MGEFRRKYASISVLLTRKFLNLGKNDKYIFKSKLKFFLVNLLFYLNCLANHTPYRFVASVTALLTALLKMPTALRAIYINGFSKSEFFKLPRQAYIPMVSAIF